MKVLVINSGSSSLKFELIDMTNEKSIAKGLCERIGISNPIFTYKNLVKGVVVKDRPEPMENHKIAIDVVLKQLQDPENGVIRNVDEIDAIGHRVVHGGEYYDDSVLVDDEVLKNLEAVSYTHLDTNETVQGRYNNRRVELFFQNVDFNNVRFINR